MDTLKWSKVQCYGRIPQVRWGGSMSHVAPDKIYLYGGRDGRFAEGYRYHPEIHELIIKKQAASSLRMPPITRMRSQDKLMKMLGTPIGSSVNGNTNSTASTTIPPTKQYAWDVVETSSIKPPASIFVTLTAVQNKLVVFGGQDDSHVYNTPHIFDLSERTWKVPQTTGNPPTPRFSHFAFVVPGENSNKLLILGGTNPGGRACNDIHILDLDKLAWSQPAIKGTGPSARDDFIPAIVGDRLWVFAGVGDHPAEFYSLDFNSMQWHKEDILGEAPSCRRGTTATPLYNRYIVVYGGVTETRIYNDVFIFDTVTRIWHKPNVGTYIPQARAGHSAAVVGNSLFIFGGEIVHLNGEMDLLDDVDTLDLSSLAH